MLIPVPVSAINCTAAATMRSEASSSLPGAARPTRVYAPWCGFVAGNILAGYRHPPLTGRGRV
ncbi:hypothetical protein ATO49_09845 [Mycolicibacterium fortuitum subsp. fortuitum DSM 46621 = ATCC 6841 = JCM 6387]|nr:hypothetical protein ATO49_09845 [Mycolicibacterium fortuitum subsp. fortuitum DSM 46621 = ATCC 6841 = JCM 6387]